MFRGLVSALALALSGCATTAQLDAPTHVPQRTADAAPTQVTLAQTRAQLADADGDVLVVAHRACWHGNAENSLAALESCKRMGVGIVELDVRTTSDGALVLMHDATVDRTTNGSGNIKDMTLAQVRELRLRSELGGARARLTDLQVPTLDEALEASRGQLMINIDPKDVSWTVLRNVLTAKGMMDHALIKTYSTVEEAPDEPLFHEAAYMPVVAQHRIPQGVGRVIDLYRKYNPVAYEIVFTEEGYLGHAVTAAKPRGYRIWVNTLLPQHAAGHVDADAVRRPDRHWGHLIDMGANMIQTDEPGALREYLRRRDALGR